MRAEIDIASPPAGAHVAIGPAVTRRWSRMRDRPDWFEFLVLIAFAAVSMWVLGLDVFQAVAHGRVWTGTDGVFIVDQMQYLAWIQAAAHHLLASNLFVLRPTPADYFQPAVVISAALAAIGVPAWLSLLLWKPVAVVAAFYGVRAYAHHSLDGTWPRRVALVLGLFFGSVTIIYGSPGVLGDLFPAFLSWGYTFGLLSIGMLLLALVAYERVHREPQSLRSWGVWVAGVLGAGASLLHPWQGEMLIVLVVGTELLLWWLDRDAPRRLTLPAVTVIVTGAPLLYYEILGRTDLSWKLARDASKHSFSLGTIVLAIVPLLVPALLAYRGRPRTFLVAATRLWPVAAFAIYFVSASSVSATPLHAFEGITVPLSILAIQGIRRVGLTRLRFSGLLVGAAVLAATVPAMVIELSDAEATVKPSTGNPNFIAKDEQKALHYLAKDKTPGGVLTRFYLGSVVPAETGRRTFVGDCLWSEPGCTPRAKLTEMMFDGSVPVDLSRWLVQEVGARFVLTDCRTRQDMTAILAPLTQSVHRFGCAAVYTLRPTVESPADQF